MNRIEDSGTRTDPEKDVTRIARMKQNKYPEKGYRTRKICIDAQDEQDRGPETEKLPEIRSREAAKPQRRL